MNEQKNCENCKHYLRYYVKDNNNIDFLGGHCAKTKGGLTSNCKLWEQSEIKPYYDGYEELRTNLRYLIDNVRRMLERLNSGR